MKTRHINSADSTGRIYCYRENALLEFTSEQAMDVCKVCPYFGDLNVTEPGVVCVFDDACNLDQIEFDDAGDSEHHCQMQYVRMGMSTEKEVLARLKSMNDYSVDEDEPDEDEDAEPEGEEDIPPEPEEGA